MDQRLLSLSLASLAVSLTLAWGAWAAGGQVSLEARDITLGELAAQVRSATAGQVILVAPDAERRVSLEVRDISIPELVDLLARQGMVVQPTSQASGAELPRASVTLRLPAITAGELASLLERHLAGSGYTVTAPQPGLRLTLEVDGEDLAMLLERLERSGILALGRP